MRMRAVLTTLAIVASLVALGAGAFFWLHSKGLFDSGGPSLDPPAFRQRPFDGRLWRATDPYVPGGRYDLRGTMLDDLLRRLRPGMGFRQARVLLGPPDQRRGSTVFWLTGGYHDLDDSCLALSIDPRRRIDRVAIIDLTNEPSLANGHVDEWCPHGVPLPASRP